eukprot:CAMPEP_0170608922 /NCGR_PEP_ID=MMETSP0224-20130122/21844_1 /TAXON_ID=285029 /ORGANISM="Togula jolla, Strain CCCM 725" /LENGTH=415 /DNA_ID=CAMNT_0010934183 /DNA_START=117 /DNA_END=1364 /DNA_ORIENTATION=+
MNNLAAASLPRQEFHIDADAVLILLQMGSANSLAVQNHLGDLRNTSASRGSSTGDQPALLQAVQMRSNMTQEIGHTTWYLKFKDAATSASGIDSSAGAGLVMLVSVLLLLGLCVVMMAMQGSDRPRRSSDGGRDRFFQGAPQRSTPPPLSAKPSPIMHHEGSGGGGGNPVRWGSPGTALNEREEFFFPQVSVSSVLERAGNCQSSPLMTPLPSMDTPTQSFPSPVPAGNLPVLCPALILPHSEAWFAVSFEKLQQASSGAFELFGLSGKPLLKVVPNISSDGRRSFTIAMTPARSPILGAVLAARAGTSASMQLKAGPGKHVGDLHPQSSSPGRYCLVTNNAEVITLNFDLGSCSLLVTSVGEGSTVALASRCSDSDFFKNTDHLQVRVNPGVDPVLVLCCVLGVVLFGSAPPLS